MPASDDALRRIDVLATTGVAHHALHPADVFGLLAELVTERLGTDVSVWLEHADPDDLEVDVGHGHRPEVVVRLAGDETWTVTVSRPAGEVIGRSEGSPRDVALAMQEMLAELAS